MPQPHESTPEPGTNLGTRTLGATAVLVLGFLAASPFMFPFIQMPEYKALMYKVLPIWD